MRCRFCDKAIHLDTVTHVYTVSGKGAVINWCTSSQDGEHRP